VYNSIQYKFTFLRKSSSKKLLVLVVFTINWHLIGKNVDSHTHIYIHAYNEFSVWFYPYKMYGSPTNYSIDILFRLTIHTLNEYISKYFWNKFLPGFDECLKNLVSTSIDTLKIPFIIEFSYYVVGLYLIS